MPLTHFPHGVSTDYDAILPIAFGSGSAASSITTKVPFKATVVAAEMFGDTAARVSNVGVTTGADGTGTDIVSAVSSASIGANATQTLALASTAVAAGHYIQCTRAAQGSLGNTTLNISLKRA